MADNWLDGFGRITTTMTTTPSNRINNGNTTAVNSWSLLQETTKTANSDDDDHNNAFLGTTIDATVLYTARASPLTIAQDMAKAEGAIIIAAICARFDLSLAPDQVRRVSKKTTNSPETAYEPAHYATAHRPNDTRGGAFYRKVRVRY